MSINYFNKGFNAVYNRQVRCPECKTPILAIANICPHCKTDFRNGNYNRLKKWQGTAYKILFLLVGIITISLIFKTEIPAIVAVIIGLALVGLGIVIITKIQSFINRQN
jgi:uncharacterized paraquat-inducible protein A